MNCTLPDPFHVKRSDAQDIADELVELIAVRGRVCLYLDAAGAVQVCEHVLDVPDPFSLVGVYDEEARATDIAADIVAMEREHIHGKLRS